MPIIKTIPAESGGSTELPNGTTTHAPTPADIARLIAKAGPDMKCLLLGNLDTGDVVFGVIGGEGYVFGTGQEYADFATAWNAYGSWPNTPADWKLPPVPAEATHETIMFVNKDQWTAAVKASFIH